MLRGRQDLGSSGAVLAVKSGGGRWWVLKIWPRYWYWYCDPVSWLRPAEVGVAVGPTSQCLRML